MGVATHPPPHCEKLFIPLHYWRAWRRIELPVAGVHYKEYATHIVVVQTFLSRFDGTTTLVHGP